MIYTVTFNPSLDYIVSIDDFQLGKTNRTRTEHLVPVITVEDDGTKNTTRKYRRVEKKADVEITCFDGEGLISPRFAAQIDRALCGGHVHTSFQTRLPYVKGMLHQVDFHTFSGPTLKICAQLSRDELAARAAEAVAGATFVRFTGEDWYAFRKAGATKAQAIGAVAGHLGLDTGDLTAFGDDLPDVDMLTLCGVGVAMGNALERVKQAADVVIGDCDSDAIADYLKGLF